MLGSILGRGGSQWGPGGSKNISLKPMLRNSVSRPEVGLPGWISANLDPKSAIAGWILRSFRSPLSSAEQSNIFDYFYIYLIFLDVGVDLGEGGVAGGSGGV